MSDQHVGVKAQFLTPSFSRGLARYLTGLGQAIAATNNTVAAINNMGAQSSAVFATLQSNARATANALKAVATAAQAANRALNTGGRRRGSATTTRTQQPGNLNAALGAATARANQQATTQINAAANATRNLGQQARFTTVSVSGLNAKTIALGTALGNIAASALRSFGSALVGFGREVLEIVTFFERLELSIAFFTARSFQAEDATLSFNEALAMGEKEAQGLAIWLQRLAVASPFTTRTVGILFRTAQAYGLTRKEAEQMTPLLLDFGAAAGLDADILERLALALGQVRSRGKLTGEEVRQLGNSGLPVRDILVKALGIANSEFDELLESGALTSNIVIPHLIEALKTFEGAGERVAFGTIGGIISAMEELREISTAKFFIGFLEPLKKSFQDLFKVLNRPEVLAFIQILGQELGVRFRDFVLGTVAAIKSYVVAVQQLDPAVRQQIIVFGAATAGVFALAAAFGLLTLAMGVIANPLVLIATTIGFLISEWTSGFAVLRGITSRVTRTIGNALGGMVRAIGATVVGFANFVSDITLGFNNLEGAAVNFGFNIGASLAEGINASGSVLASALGGIGKLLSFFLAPGSPPRIAPDIDDWGEATMEEYIAAFGNANVRKSLGGGLSIVSDAISDELIKARRNAVDKLNAAHPDLNLSLVEDLQQVVLEGYEKTKEQLQDSQPVETAAVEAGIRVSDSFVEGFLSRIPAMTARVSEELQEVLDKIGGGAQLTRAGAMSFGRFLQGFDEADFGVLDNVTDVVQNFLQSLVDTGEIEDVDLPRLLFGARQDLAQGIQDIERVGHVTESTMQRIRLTAGGASTFVLDLLNAYAPLHEATERVEEAQTTLNDVTEKYKNIITPLRKELEAINEANRMADDEEKILSLRRLIANEAVSDRRRRNAQLEIDQIIAEQRVRGLENERDAAVETAETELEAREKTQEKLDDQFQTLQATIQAQLSQLDLFSQEASIITRLREEAEKLREKELSQTDLQLKFLELQNEEVQDLIAAARAKHTLEDASSTLLEKETAQITLAEIALRRRNREAEAIKLGIPVEELTKLRDFEVTLDDIGVKVKDAFTAPDTDAFGESIVDADAITKEWERTLAEVRDRWNEIKTNIKETLTEINTNLPSFLKIFPEVEGGEPPIIGFIRNYTIAIVGLAVAMTTHKIIVRLVALTTAIRGLLFIGGATAAGGAAAGAGTAAGAGGLTVFGALITSIGLLAAEALVAYGALILLGKAMEAIGFDMRPADVINAEAVAGTLGEAQPGINKAVDDLIADVKPTPQAREALSQSIVDATVFAIQDGFGSEHVVASVGNAINRAIVEGLIADTPANRTAIELFTLELWALLGTASTGEAPKINILTGAKIEAAPTTQQAAQVKTDVQSFLAGITDEETKGAFAENMKSLITDATNLGMQRAQIDTLVFGAFNEGIKAGLVADSPTNRAAISDYIDGIVNQLKTKSEIDSPSKLAKREIGLPIGMGIINGINAALILQRSSVITELGEVFGSMKTLMTFRMAEILFDQQTNWKAIRTTGETESSTLKTSVLTTFGSLLTTLTARMLAIKAIVVSGFTTMRTESEAQALLLKTNIIRLFAGEEGSILDAIETVFLGKDDIVPRNIGKDFITGIGLGITENQDLLGTAITGALIYALGQAQTGLEAHSPSSLTAREIGLPFSQGIAQGIMEGLGTISGAARFAMLAAVSAPLEARFGSHMGAINSAVSTNISRVSHYHLNVQSAMQSQGIAHDFGIMKTLEG